MLRPLAVALVIYAPMLRAGEHLVSAEQVQMALAATASQRAADLSRLDELLARPEASQAAALSGASLRHVRQALPSLTDAELHDLAARSVALERDPVAGHWAGPLAVGAVLGIVLFVVSFLVYLSQQDCCF